MLCANTNKRQSSGWEEPNARTFAKVRCDVIGHQPSTQEAQLVVIRHLKPSLHRASPEPAGQMVIIRYQRHVAIVALQIAWLIALCLEMIR